VIISFYTLSLIQLTFTVVNWRKNLSIFSYLKSLSVSTIKLILKKLSCPKELRKDCQSLLNHVTTYSIQNYTPYTQPPSHPKQRNFVKSQISYMSKFQLYITLPQVRSTNRGRPLSKFNPRTLKSTTISRTHSCELNQRSHKSPLTLKSLSRQLVDHLNKNVHIIFIKHPNKFHTQKSSAIRTRGKSAKVSDSILSTQICKKPSKHF